MKGLNLRVVLLLLGILSVSLFLSMQQIKEGFYGIGDATPTPTGATGSTGVSGTSNLPGVSGTITPDISGGTITPDISGTAGGTSGTSSGTTETTDGTISPATLDNFNPEKFSKGLHAIASSLILNVQGLGSLENLKQPFSTRHSPYP